MAKAKAKAKKAKKAKGRRKVPHVPRGYHAVTPYVVDVDRTFRRAVAAGAKVKREVQDQFYGDRIGTLEDPFGHTWHLATHVEDVSMAELKKRAAATAKAAEKKS